MIAALRLCSASTSGRPIVRHERLQERRVGLVDQALRLGGDRAEDQRGLARAGHPGEHGQAALGDVERDVQEVVLPGAADLDHVVAVGRVPAPGVPRVPVGARRACWSSAWSTLGGCVIGPLSVGAPRRGAGRAVVNGCDRRRVPFSSSGRARRPPVCRVRGARERRHDAARTDAPRAVRARSARSVVRCRRPGGGSGVRPSGSSPTRASRSSSRVVRHVVGHVVGTSSRRRARRRAPCGPATGSAPYELMSFVVNRAHAAVAKMAM